MLARVGRSLTSRAAAYAVAAICLAAAVGLAVQQSPVDRIFIPLPAMVPGGPTNVRPDASVARPSTGHSGQAVATSTRSVAGPATSVERYAGALVPAVTAVADAGRSARSLGV